MTKREAFIKIVQEEIFNHYDIWTENYGEDFDLASAFWEDFKDSKTKTSSKLTENGQKVLAYMQENFEKTDNVFTSKDVAEALFTSGRSISGSMRKLVTDGYVEKTGKDPIQYSLTATGKEYKFEK